MHQSTQWGVALCVAGVLGGCVAARDTSVGGEQQYIGWYRDQSAAGLLQLCGRGAPVPVADPASIRAQARATGLSTRDPVYVRLRGTATSTGIKVTRVDQIGSPTPARDCAMTGVVRRSATL